MIEAVCVDPAQVIHVWPKVKNLILVAMQRGGLGSFAVVEKAVLIGDMLLWLALEGGNIRGAAVTSLEKTEWDKSCVIVACGGKEVDQWIDCLGKIEEYAKAEGCKSVRIFGRIGWQSLLPAYRPYRVVLEREL